MYISENTIGAPCWLVLMLLSWQVGWNREESVEIPYLQEEIQARRQAARRLLHRAGRLVQIICIESISFFLRNNAARSVISKNSPSVIKPF